MYLISAYFDEESERTLRRYMKYIEEYSGNNFMSRNKVPPHLTISSIEARSDKYLKQAFLRSVEQVSMGEIDIVSIGMILPHIIYGTTVLNDYLQILSETFYDNFKDIPDVKLVEYYRPKNWLPHITLGKTLNSSEMHKGLEIMIKHFTPLRARIERIGISRTNPYSDILISDLCEE